MLCSNYNGKLKMQYFIIDEVDDENDGGSSSHSIHHQVNFSGIQDANEVDKETITYIKNQYIKGYALFNVNKSKDYVTLIENKIWDDSKKDKFGNSTRLKKKHKLKLKNDDRITVQYNRICNHFRFDFDYTKKKNPQSVNIIFDVHSKPPMVIITAARNNNYKCRRITMTSDFTRIQK